VDIHQATNGYESWVAQQTRIVRADLRLKHERMAESPFVFLRGTFYRWLQRWPSLCPTQSKAPRVLAVGDLHIENFGTWRDSEGRLAWGINDVDEACTLPYTHDLVRLATSALLAAREQRLTLTLGEICDAILDGYHSTLTRGGRAFILAERATWLRDIALGYLRDPVQFWRKLEALPTAPRHTAPERQLRAALPDPRLPFRVVRRIAGVGSLGRPRFVAIAHCGGGFLAREAKARVPSAAVWLNVTRGTGPLTMQTILKRAVRMPDPFLDIQPHWIVRRLAPDCSRVELADLPRGRDETKLLRAMGCETANIHLGTPKRQLAHHLAQQPKNWLNESAKAMAQAVIADWRDWRA
jgi:Uncharacterized protein conserved in bacteria (DUF2252)